MLERKDGTTTNNDTDIATILYDYFCTVFTSKDSESLPQFVSRSFSKTFDKLNVTPEQVHFQLSRPNTNKSAVTVPDNCHRYILFKVCDGLLYP